MFKVTPIAQLLCLSAAIVSLAPSSALAEGSAELGTTQQVQASTAMSVDILNAGETISWTGSGTLTIRDGGGTVMDTLASGGTSVGLAAGTYGVTMSNNNSNFDISVSGTASGFGRLHSTLWSVNASDYAEIRSTNASIYALVSGGDPTHSGVVELKLDGLAGWVYTLFANSTGLDGGRSQTSEISDPELELYLNPPETATYTVIAPTVTNAGFDGGTGGTVCSSIVPGVSVGEFTFDTNVEGTYHLICDLNGDGDFDLVSGDDFVDLGTTIIGTNTVPWDGNDNSGAAVAEGDYDCEVRVAVGEFHYIGTDMETSYEGMRMFSVDDALNRVGLPMFWSDVLVQGSAVTMPNGLVGLETSGPNGLDSGDYGVSADPNVNSRAWGQFAGNGKGNTNSLDTYTRLDISGSFVQVVRITNNLDDDDSDGLTNYEEDCVIGTSTTDNDSDDDGIPDDVESTPNGGGAPGLIDSDGDGTPDPLDTDSDDDGVPDAIEGFDVDGDGAADVPPSGQDLDMDGLDDAYDSACTPGCSMNGIDAPLPNFDGDSAPNWRDPDDDGDGTDTDLEDTNGNGNPNDDDADGDGIPNYLETCADLLVTGSESCDDGNAVNGDGCDDSCQEEPGYSCVGAPSSCATVCGDGIVTGAEECDDGNTTPGEGCDDSCLVEPGFTCPIANMLCLDVDECAMMLDNCSANATCTNTPGSFTCACDAGYVGDGVTCVECFGDGDCGGGQVCAADNTCVSCTDTSGGAGQDNGCTLGSPICDGAGTPAAVCEVCVDSGVGVDDGCGGATTICDTAAMINACVACIDTAAGTAEDDGCGAGAPICDGSGTPAATCVECLGDADCGAGSVCAPDNTCVGCFDDAAGAAEDSGCDAASPICDGAGTPAALCVACVDSGAGLDEGCGAGVDVCDTTGADNVCVTCMDTAPGLGQDSGCGLAAPICDGAGTPAAICVECLGDVDCGGGSVCAPDNTCVACHDSAAGNVQDSGCDASSPICDLSGTPGALCVECLGDVDCGAGSVCAPDNTCVSCFDDAAGAAEDSGCDAASPICDGAGTPAALCVACVDSGAGLDDGCGAGADVCDTAGVANECVPCMDTAAGSGEDDGCGAGAPVCDGAGTPGAICVECAGDADCGGGVCAPDNTCVTCFDDALGGAEDSGCDPSNPICDLSGTPGALCVTCVDSGAAGDDGCSMGATVCDTAVALNQCVLCLDTAGGASMDEGCGAVTPICEGSGTVGAACVACVDDAADQDTGCSMSAPACDESAGGGPSCFACLDDTSGGTDSGCDAATPACDASGGAPACTLCEDDTASGQDNGCDALEPHCVDAPGMARCVECEGGGDCALGEFCNPAGVCTSGCDEDADCGGGTPVCDVGSMTCVACNVDGDCAAGVCAPARHECIECIDDMHCGAGEVCDVANDTCVGCVGDDDCAAGTYCDVRDQTCTQSCRSDDDCAATDPDLAVCDEGVCVDCLDDDDCAADELCDVDLSACVPGCADDSACMDAGAPVCDPMNGICVECADDDDCPMGQGCDVATQQCVAECGVDGDCVDSDRPVCEAGEGICVGCVDDGDCGGSAPSCDVSNHTCVACGDDGDCAAGEVCDLEGRTCVTGCNTDGDCLLATHPVCDVDEGVCVECRVSADCADGERCEPELFICEPGCSADVECEEGSAPACEVESRTCVECTSDLHCGPDAVCDASRNICLDLPSGGLAGGALGACSLGAPTHRGALPWLTLFAVIGLALTIRRRRRT